MKRNLFIGTAYVLALIVVIFNIQILFGNIFISLILIILGLLTLIIGGDMLVNGSSSLAIKYDIPPIVVGLTIVSFGTSAPELVVSLLSAIKGNADLSISNVIGSNMINLLLILGISAYIYRIKVNKSTLHYEIPFSLISSVILFIIVNDRMISGASEDILSRGDGLVLLSFFGVFMYYIYRLLRVGNIESEVEEISENSTPRSLIFIILGMIGLYIGGKLTVEGSVFIAESYGVSQMLIGATIIGIGTSLPELVASVIAALKKKSDIAIGNVIGSNIFNLLWILGLSGSIININYNNQMNFDLILLTLATCVLLLIIKFTKGHYISKKIGIGLILLYIFYLAVIIIRG
ncbi:MAG: calcium/sodium antiporter [Candidatus Absconditabacteria bacterium]